MCIRDRPVPFAQGGVIQSPITFPLGQGRMGIAGERGAEAIMPLARGSDGRLGVMAHGGSGAINVTFNVSTTDADSFRRSESQVAAMLARAVSFGHRNL
jgi:phage-related minor tail protein